MKDWLMESLNCAKGARCYELKNHLGNVLVTVADWKVGREYASTDSVDWYVGAVLTQTDYFPFGWGLPGRQASSPEYRYGYNGQEKDDELLGEGNSLTFRFRISDARLGRFLSVDPLAPEYPWYTPYQFAGNKVIAFAELEGLEEKNSVPCEGSTEGEHYKPNFGQTPTGSSIKFEYFWHSGSTLFAGTINQQTHSPGWYLPEDYQEIINDLVYYNSDWAENARKSGGVLGPSAVPISTPTPDQIGIGEVEKAPGFYQAFLSATVKVMTPIPAQSQGLEYVSMEGLAVGAVDFYFGLKSLSLLWKKTEAPTAIFYTPKSNALRPVGMFLESIDDVMANPFLLKGKHPLQVEAILGKTPGWQIETLGKGSQKGSGWVFREYTTKGNATGRQLRWHPGGGHKGPEPYWRVKGYNGDLGGVIR